MFEVFAARSRTAAIAVAASLAAAGVRHICIAYFGYYTPLLILHVAAVSVVGQYRGTAAGLITTSASFVLIPYQLDPIPDPATLLVFLVLGLFLSVLGGRRLQAEREQKRMAEELQRINETMSLAFEAGNSGGWSWNLESAELFWTTSYYRLLGVDPALKPSPELFYSLVHPKDLSRLKKSLDDAIQGRVTEFCMEFRVRNGDSIRWLERRGRVWRNWEGKVVRIIGITTDITERKILRGLLPTCAQCKKIRDEHDEWHVLEEYITEHSEARFSHGLCPDCLVECAKASGIEDYYEAGSAGGR